MNDAGYSVTLIAPGNEDETKHGVHIAAIGVARNRLHRMTVFALRAYLRARKENAAIYHFHDPELLPWMLLLRCQGHTVVFDVHENIPASMHDREWIPRLFRPMVSKLITITLRHTLQFFSVIFAEDSYPKAYDYSGHHVIVRNLPDLNVFAPLENTSKFDEFTVVYVGSITESRGIRDFLDALKILEDKSIPIHGIVIGQQHLGPNQSLQTLISERGLGNVQFYGYTPQPTAMVYVRKSHAGFAVLQRRANYLESFPTKVFEYMGCGIPFLISDFPYYREALAEIDAGLFVKPGCPSAIAEAILRLKTSGDLASDMGERGKRAVTTRLNWNYEAQRLLRLYAKLIDRQDNNPSAMG